MDSYGQLVERAFFTWDLNVHSDSDSPSLARIAETQWTMAALSVCT